MVATPYHSRNVPSRFATMIGMISQPGHRCEYRHFCPIADGWRFQIADLDGRRIEKVLATDSKLRECRSARKFPDAVAHSDTAA